MVNVGCGLDTRYQRVGNDGKAVFYELDLPEVIAIRRRLIPEPENDCYLSASVVGNRLDGSDPAPSSQWRFHLCCGRSIDVFS